MKQIKTEVEIEASAERVWSLLCDFEKYPDWNPFIRRIHGNLKVGGILTVHIQAVGMNGMTFFPTILVLEPNRELRWRGRVLFRGLFDGEHVFSITQIAPDRVRFTQQETFKGLLVSLMAKALDTHVRHGFEAMNQALKKLAESTET